MSLSNGPMMGPFHVLCAVSSTGYRLRPAAGDVGAKLSKPHRGPLHGGSQTHVVVDELVVELVQIPFREQSDALVQGRLPSCTVAAAEETRRAAQKSLSEEDVMMIRQGGSNEGQPNLFSKPKSKLLEKRRTHTRT